MGKRRDPKLCWSCGEPGLPEIGSRMHCKGCEVTWMPWASMRKVSGPPDGNNEQTGIAYSE